MPQKLLKPITDVRRYDNKNFNVMENKTYIISFGNSTKYRFTPALEDLSMMDVRDDVKAYLAKKYPELETLGYYDKMQVEPLTPENSMEYAGYKEFDKDSIAEIKQVLSTEIDGMDSLRELNSNAPWGIGAEKD